MVAKTNGRPETEEVFLRALAQAFVHIHPYRFDLLLLCFALAGRVDNEQKQIGVRDLVSAVVPVDLFSSYS